MATRPATTDEPRAMTRARARVIIRDSQARNAVRREQVLRRAQNLGRLAEKLRARRG